MRLLQWNIWYQEKAENILELLREARADIICIQEATVNHPRHGVNFPEHLATELKLHHVYQPADTKEVDGKEESFGNVILSRFPIQATRSTFIQKPPEGGEPVDYSQEGRVYLEALLETDTGPLTVGTVHMSYTDRFVSTPEKEQEAKNLFAAIENNQERYLIAGDFNALPGSFTITEMEKRFKNAGPELAANTWTTKPFSYKGFEAHSLDWRLDYCFASKDIKVLSSEVVQTPYSDHLPLLVEFQ